MEINVTQKHIDEGCMEDGNNCPVAKALLDAGLNGVFVDQDYIKFEHPLFEGAIRIETPLVVEEFVSNFDNGYPVEPFEFDL